MAIKRILICPDTFKGTLSSLGVTQTVAQALSASKEANFRIDMAPMSDGGAGLLDSLLNGCKGLTSVAVKNIVGPLGLNNPIDSRFALHAEGKYAVVEMAEASGLPLVDKRLKEINDSNMARSKSFEKLHKDPRLTTSFGTGQLMDYIAKNYSPAQVERIYIGIGGSSTNDAGFGALQALGMDIYLKGDNNGERKLTEPFTGGHLKDVTRIDLNTTAFKTFRNRFPGKNIILLCDVSNPLLGPHGATMIYGPQKGANGKTPQPILDELEAGMTNVADIINAHLKTNRNTGTSGSEVVTDIGTMKGAGGAGGMSGGFYALLNANWQAGAEVLQNVFLQLDERIAQADIIITGEGRFDNQTIQYGKTVASIYKAMLKGMEEKERQGIPQKPKLFVVVCGLYQGPPMEGTSYVPSLSIKGKVDIHGFALSPKRFTSHAAMTQTAECLKVMVEKDVKPFLEGYVIATAASKL